MTCTHSANDLIESVAFGFATNEERRVVLNHVDDCGICAAALDDARFAAMVMPLSVSEADIDLPASIWAGIESRISAEAPAVTPEQPRAISSPTRVAPVSRPPFRVHWAVAAVLALLTLAAGVLLGSTLFETDDTSDQTVAQVTVTDPNLTASGTVEYVEDQGVVVLRMQDMPPAPQGYVYQVWVIDGDTPVSAGTMDPGSSSFATTADPTEFQTLAVTLEEGPFGNEQPTTDPIVVADLTPLGGD
jgi:anti-sigma-K factor RskA